jgi:hypothetical protein
LLTFPLKVRAFLETLVFVTVVHGKLQARRKTISEKLSFTLNIRRLLDNKKILLRV